MNHTNTPSGAIWPTPFQENILKASLCKGEMAWQAWLNCRENIEKDYRDIAAQELYPLLYSNLTEQQFYDPLLNQLKQKSMLTWTHNKLKFQNLEKCLNIFHSENIDTLILKGAAFIPLYYQDYKVRGFGDVDILVPQHNCLIAAALLEEFGWLPETTMDHADVRFQKEFCLIDSKGFILDLHNRLFDIAGKEDACNSLWKASVPLSIGKADTRTLCSTDHLVHICAHGLIMGKYPPIRWIADADKLLGVAVQTIDWERLIKLSNSLNVQLQVSKALEYLKEKFNSPIPDDILNTLCQQQKVSRSDKVYVRLLMQGPPRGKMINAFFLHFYRYRKNARTNRFADHLRSYPRYLTCLLKTNKPIHLIYQIFIRLFRTICYRFGIDLYND